MRGQLYGDETQVIEESPPDVKQGPQHDLITEIKMLKKARLHIVDKRSRSVL